MGADVAGDALRLALPRSAAERMLEAARLIFALKRNPVWLAHLEPMLPAAARVTPDQPSLLMGYDFHLTDDGPRLIEINNNAGGLFQRGEWLPQPTWRVWHEPLEARLRAMFPPSWRRLAIVDAAITEQPMYPEMAAYARLLEAEGRTVRLCTPEEIEGGAEGLFLHGMRIDAIYNRHTDFYLESPEMAAIRAAFTAGTVALNPHPRSYALIGDKGRLADIWLPGLLEEALPAAEVAAIRALVPPTLRMRDRDPDWWWRRRKQWVFKPTARHGGKGVMRGGDISRARFARLDLDDMVAQQLVPPGRVEVDGVSFKADFRLYMHGATPIALAGRIWRGAVTNFRHPGSGWAVVELTEQGGQGR
ncbi:MAG: hypothetical protein D6682_07280 [Zetaproteobacteria bacterium]|nr:MAG: hypothetical protein D6682_07280 [Zetaproteobacteria bacterium]